MTPLADDEKRTITRHVQELKHAMNAGQPNVPERFSALQTSRRGDLHAFVDGFDEVMEMQQWLRHLEAYLIDVVEARVTLDVPYAMLDDLASDPGEQARIEAQLSELIARTGRRA